VRATVLDQPGSPLRVTELADPEPGPGQLLVAVEACGVCRTDLHLRDGELEPHGLPRVLGHQVVGTVLAAAPDVGPGLPGVGRRVGIPWLGWTCGQCRYCTTGRENLCRRARFTGRDLDGGFAERTVADARFCLPLPEGPSALELAPLLCAGLIGWRALRLAGDDAVSLGLYGFGSSAHVIAQVAHHQGRRLFAFTRRGDDEAQALARELGVEWVGPSDEQPPEPLDAAIVFASAGELVPTALHALAPGGTVVCAGIHMTDIPSFPYADLWEERSIRSVANLTRRDGEEFLALAPRVPVRTHTTRYPLEGAEQALADLRAGAFSGSAVVEVASVGPA